MVLGKKYWGVIQMSVDIKQIGDMKIKVVSEDDSISYKDIISDQDAEMDKHWKRCVMWAWNDHYQSPCGNEENRTHRLYCSTRIRILLKKRIIRFLG